MQTAKVEIVLHDTEAAYHVWVESMVGSVWMFGVVMRAGIELEVSESCVEKRDSSLISFIQPCVDWTVTIRAEFNFMWN